MDAYLHQVIDATITILAITMLGLVALVMTFPIQTLVVSSAFTLLMLRRHKTARRLQDWYLWFPLQRFLHRLYVPTRRRIKRGLMCRVKKSVIARIIDDALSKAVEDKHINNHDYRELCVKIALALSNAELMPRGKRSRELIRRTVEKNCKEMRESLAKAGRIPGKPDPLPEVKPSALIYLRNRRAA